MPLLTVMPEGEQYSFVEGATILETLLAHEVGVPHKCNGQAKCGSCHIFLQEGRKSCSKIGKLENEKLDSIVGIGSKSRLACQVTLGTENVTIELLGFASGL